MFAMTRPRLLVALIGAPALAALVAFAAFSSEASADHTWNDYHWGHTGSSFALQLDDNLSTSWKPYLKDASSLTNTTYDPNVTSTHDWNDSTVLDTIIKPSTNTKRCRPTSGRVEVCNASYGKNGWVGLASVWVSGGHIVQGTAKMNDSYYMDKYTKQQVMCQEVGHTFGLGHQDVSRNSTFDSCMTYDDPTATTDQWPDAHDYQLLEKIYNTDPNSGGHADSSNTFGSTGAASKLPPAAREIDPSDPAQRGNRVHRSPNGRVELYERDFGRGHKVITRVVRVDEATPPHDETTGPGRGGEPRSHDDHE